MNMRVTIAILVMSLIWTSAGKSQNWYEKSFYLMHLDHHTQGEWEVGRDADPDETARLISLSKPDVIQIHAKGNPGWTTYPTKIGYTPHNLRRDVMQIWRDVANRLRVPFIAYYNFGRDGCLMENRPEFNRVNLNGELYSRMLCFNSGVEKVYLWPMIREIMLKYNPEGFWFDGSCFTVNACFCERCRLYFRSVYGKEPPSSNESPDWELYKEMHREFYRKVVRETIEVIHEINPECLVAFNFAYSMHMPEKPDEGIAFLSGDISGRIDRLSVAGRLYDTQGKPFDLMTPIFNNGEGGQIPKRLEHQKQETAVIIANGGRFFAWDNPSRESGLNESRQSFLGELAPWLRERHEFCLNTKRIRDVSVLNIAAAHYASYRNATACFRQDNPPVQAASNSLVKKHILHDVIADWKLLEGNVDARLLIAENPEAVPEKVVYALDKFARNGGTVLLTGKAPLSGGGPLCEILGIAKADYKNENDTLHFSLRGVNYSFESEITRVSPAGAGQVTEIAFGRDGMEIPFLTKMKRGKGNVYYCSAPLFLLSEKGVLPDEILNYILAEVLPPDARTFTSDAPETVETTLRMRANIRMLHLVNRANGEETGETFSLVRKNIPPTPPLNLTLSVPSKPLSVSMEPEGMILKGWKYEGNRLTLSCPPFDTHRIIVVTLGR